MQKNKGFSKNILIIIILIVLGGGYYLWQKQTPTTCEHLENKEKSDCIEKLAVETKNPVLCAGLIEFDSSGALSENCYAAVAPIVKDYQICEKIKRITVDRNYPNEYFGNSNYYYCRSDVSIALNDIETCRNIEDVGETEKNKAEFGDSFYTDQRTKEIVKDVQNIYRNWCTVAIAENTKNTKLCDLLEEKSDNYPFSKEDCSYVVRCKINPNNCKLN